MIYDYVCNAFKLAYIDLECRVYLGQCHDAIVSVLPVSIGFKTKWRSMWIKKLRERTRLYNEQGIVTGRDKVLNVTLSLHVHW